MKLVKFTFLIITIVLTNISCNNSNEIKNGGTLSDCDTVLRLDTPFFKKFDSINKFGRLDATYEFTQRDINAAGLRNYKYGYDSIVIRVWYDYAKSETDIIEIRKNCENWVAELITIKRSMENDKILATIIKKKILDTPKSGWNNFTKRLFELNVTTLPPFSDIPNYDAASDGYSVDIEIATKSYYRVYSYLQPRSHVRFKEAEAVVKIMELIDEEFGIERKIKI